MSIYITFLIPGPAVGKQEAARLGHTKAGKLIGCIYTKTKSRTYMKHVAECARQAIRDLKYTDLPTDDPLSIEIIAFFARPKSVPLTRKYPINPVDCTNIQKGIEDALHKPDPIVFKNDCHVTDIHTSKRYCGEGMEPHTRVEIWTTGTKRYDIKRGGPKV